MRTKGFTLIELMIVVAIIGILAAIIVPAVLGGSNRSSAPSNAVIVSPPNQVSATRCVGGFLFTIDGNRVAKPATDDQARAVSCQ